MTPSAFAEIDDMVLDDRIKGMPAGVAPFPLAEIGRHGWNVLAEDLPLPLAVLKESAVARNTDWMARFVAGAGALLAPHGKTTMSPQLFRRQLDAGAWAVTVATIHQLQVCRRFGVRRVVLANQLVGRQAIAAVIAMLRDDPGLDFYCLVDSEAGVGLLARALAADPPGRPLQVLLEGGYPDGRTGCRDLATAMRVARAVRDAAPHLALRGVEGFEGLMTGATLDEAADKAAGFLDGLVAMARAADEGGCFADGPVILSAGGSAFYDVVAQRFQRAGIGREVLTLTRSGCYIAHDSLMYRDHFAALRARAPGVDGLGPGLTPALEVWAYVQSRPEPTKAILTMGKRDVGTDAGNPVAETWMRPGEGPPRPLGAGHVATMLNDQHTHLTVPADSPLAVGDMVSFGVSHPCTTFDRWQVIPVVDDAYRVVSAIRTYF